MNYDHREFCLKKISNIYRFRSSGLRQEYLEEISDLLREPRFPTCGTEVILEALVAFSAFLQEEGDCRAAIFVGRLVESHGISLPAPLRFSIANTLAVSYSRIGRIDLADTKFSECLQLADHGLPSVFLEQINDNLMTHLERYLFSEVKSLSNTILEEIVRENVNVEESYDELGIRKTAFLIAYLVKQKEPIPCQLIVHAESLLKSDFADAGPLSQSNLLRAIAQKKATLGENAEAVALLEMSNEIMEQEHRSKVFQLHNILFMSSLSYKCDNKAAKDRLADAISDLSEECAMFAVECGTADPSELAFYQDLLTTSRNMLLSLMVSLEDDDASNNRYVDLLSKSRNIDAYIFRETHGLRDFIESIDIVRPTERESRLFNLLSDHMQEIVGGNRVFPDQHNRRLDLSTLSPMFGSEIFDFKLSSIELSKRTSVEVFGTSQVLLWERGEDSTIITPFFLIVGRTVSGENVRQEIKLLTKENFLRREIDSYILEMLRSNGSLNSTNDFEVLRSLAVLLSEAAKYCQRNSEKSLTVVADGPLFMMPLGNLAQSFGLCMDVPISYALDLKLRFSHPSDPSEIENVPTDHGVVVHSPEFDQGRSFLEKIFKPVGVFSSLDNAEAEGIEIIKITGARQISSRSAVRSSVVELNSPDFLHIASHGFTSLQADEFDFPSVLDAFIDGDPANRDLWMRSVADRHDDMGDVGIALTGANSEDERWSRNSVLTAKDFCGMNLSGTGLVSLAACSTASSSINVGDSAFGFARGIYIAGAKFALLSLWPVNDQMTKTLFVSIYRELAQGASVFGAVERGRSEVRIAGGEFRDYAGFALFSFH